MGDMNLLAAVPAYDVFYLHARYIVGMWTLFRERERTSFDARSLKKIKRPVDLKILLQGEKT